MKAAGCRPVSCNGNTAWLGGVAGADFAALDELAVKLICLDGGFSTPLREMGRILGERIAREHGQTPLSLDTALSVLISACGLEGKIEWRFLSAQ